MLYANCIIYLKSLFIPTGAYFVYSSATDDIPGADEIRTLVKDIWDLRVAKLRKSTDTFVKSDATHAKVRVN